MVQTAKDGDLEGFKVLHDKMTQDVLMPFVQLDGGYQAGLHYIDHLADTEVKYLNDNGVHADLNETKTDLREKLTRYKKIYDRIVNTHEMNMNVKYAPEDKAVYQDFSNYVFNNKFDTENSIEYKASRVNELRDQLKNFKATDTTSVPIISDETKYSTKMVDDLKSSLDSKRSELSPADIASAQQIIQNIDGHVQLMGLERDYLKSLYSKKALQEGFASFKEYRSGKVKDSNEAASTSQKQGETTTLPQHLKDLYDKTVSYEKLTDAEPTRDSGDIQVNFTDEEGSKHKLTVSPIGTTERGSMSVEAKHDEVVDKDGKVDVKDITDRTTHFLNSDGSIEYDGKNYKLDGEPIVTKTADEARTDRARDEVMDVMNRALDHYKEGLATTEDRILKGKKYIADLTDRVNKLLDKESKSLKEYGTALTKSGAERKQSVLVART